MSEFSEFAKQMLETVAASFGVPYNVMAHQYDAMHMQASIHFTSAMLRLCSSKDRRQRKRGLRLYFQANGSSAPISPLSMRVEGYRHQVQKQIMQNAINDLYLAWAKDAAARGMISSPPTMAQQGNSK